MCVLGKLTTDLIENGNTSPARTTQERVVGPTLESAVEIGS
jgi:hypothetical protein